MIEIRTLVLLVCTLMILAISPAHGGAWTRKQNSFYAKLGLTTLSTNEFHTKDGDKIETADFHTWSLNLYGEYGVTDRLTGILRAPILRSAGFETTESFTGIGDIGLELKYGLLTGSTPVAVSFGADFPTGDETGTGSLKTGAGGYIRLPTGDGELNTRVSALVSHSFYPTPAYASFDLGYNVRSEGFTDEYAFGLQGGYKVFEEVWIQANLRGIGPVANPDATLAGGTALGYGEGVQYIAYNLGASYEVIPRVSVSFDFFSAFGRITNIYSGANLVFGLSFET